MSGGDEGLILGFSTVAPSEIDVERISATRRKRLPFYERYGFVEFPPLSDQLGDRPEPRPMFLELGAIPHASD